MKNKIVALCAGVIALSAAGATLAQETPPAAPVAATEQTPPAEATAPAEVTPPAEAAPVIPGVVNAPPAGKGQIVFFRPSRFVGAALSFTVRENDVDLGRLPNGRYFVQVADPGIHGYEIGRNDTMRIEIEEGETYFVMENTTMGIMAGRAVLTPSDQAAFQEALPHMRVSEPPRQH